MILVYETIGGLRAVAWTDVAQGILLLVGLAGVLAAIVPGPAHMREITQWIAAAEPAKVAVPDWSMSVNWASTTSNGTSGSRNAFSMRFIIAR